MASTMRQSLPLPVAAARLKMTWAQVYNAVLSGKLDGRQLGGRWFVTEASVKRMLDGEATLEKLGKSSEGVV